MTNEPERGEATGAVGIRAIPGGVWALGFVSLLMDVGSRMIHGLLPRKGLRGGVN